MCRVALILHCFFLQAHAKEAHENAGKVADNSVDKLLGRLLVDSSVPHAGVDDAILGKPGQLSIAQRSPLVSAPMVRPLAISKTVRATRNSQLPPMTGPTNVNVVVPPPIGSTDPGVYFDKVTGQMRKDKAVLLYLVDRKLQAVTGPEALEMMKNEGAVLVDSRLEESFKKGTMEGAVNLALYRPVQGGSLFDNAKRLVTGLAGVQATERNPDFAAQAEKLLPHDRPIIVACARGGRLKGSTTDRNAEEAGLRAVNYDGTGVGAQRVEVAEPTAHKPEDTPIGDPFLEIGWESRSLKTAYELYHMGYTNLYFLLGGITKWEHDKLPWTSSK
jgi:rhodanese-related sulfurtransferase